MRRNGAQADWPAVHFEALPSALLAEPASSGARSTGGICDTTSRSLVGKRTAHSSLRRGRGRPSAFGFCLHEAENGQPHRFRQREIGFAQAIPLAVSLQGVGICPGLIPGNLIEQSEWRDVEQIGNPHQPGDREAVPAGLVFLQLLVTDTNLFRNVRQ